MSYVTNKHTYQPVAILGAIGIPAAFAGLLVVGLAVKAVVDNTIDEPITGVTVTPYIPPPPPKPVEDPDPRPKSQPNETITYVPDTRFPAPRDPSDIETTGQLDPIGDIDLGEINNGDLGLGGGMGGDVAPKATFDPVGAKPSNNASRWITDSDYRSSWVRREYSGNASFLLEVSTSGRVTDCTITQSTGHEVLDTATCKLITKRARFNPALNSEGAPTTGSFKSSVNWQLPK